MFCGDVNRSKSKKRGNVCICMADSLYCAAETNTTLKSNYTPVKSNFQKSMNIMFGNACKN